MDQACLILEANLYRSDDEFSVDCERIVFDAGDCARVKSRHDFAELVRLYLSTITENSSCMHAADCADCIQNRQAPS